MRACPKCNAPAETAADAYCEVCGFKLPNATESAQVPTRPPTEGTHRLRRGERVVAPPAEESEPTTLRALGVAPAGTKLGDVRVVAQRSDDDADGVTIRDGERVVVAFAPNDAYFELEASAIARVGDDPRFPTIVARGTGEHGSWLALSAAPDATPLAKAAPSTSLADALAVLDSLLDVAARLERAGFTWTPIASDVTLHANAVKLVRVRVAAMLEHESSRADMRPVLHELGSVFAPLPAALGPPGLAKLLASLRRTDVDRARAALASVRSEAALPSAVSDVATGATDLGLRHAKNEDAFATAHGDVGGKRWAVLVVCDGVSTSTRAEEASGIAARTACDALAHFARSGDIGHETSMAAVAAAVRAAHVAVCATKIDHGTTDPPGTTIVAALLHGRRLSVGWVGDSRAYWIGPAGGELLTTDHSWVNEAVARGEVTPEEAADSPLAHAITRCLGPLEDPDAIVEPDVRSRDLAGPGVVLLCSDGLWNYFPDPCDLAAAVREAGAFDGRASLDAIARVLVNRALLEGGADNVSVALARP